MREMFVQLQRGVYNSSKPLTDLTSLFERFGERATFKLDRCPRWLHVDGSILLLCLEEAFSNAAKYRDPLRPFIVQAGLSYGTRDTLLQRLHNYQGTPFTTTAPDVMTESGIFDDQTWLHMCFDNVNAPGLEALTAEKCDECLAEGFKGGDSRAEFDGRSSRISDGLGLSSVRRATFAAGGSAKLTTYVDAIGGQHTVLHCLLPCTMSDQKEGLGSRVSSFQAASSNGESLGSFATAEPSFRLSSVDAQGDSSILTAQDAATATKGGDGGVRSANQYLSGNDARGDSEERREGSKCAQGDAGPRCYAIDDSAIMRSMLNFVFAKLGADDASQVFGARPDDVEHLIAIAGEGDGSADLVILDEHIVVPFREGSQTPGERTVRGSALAQQMREGGFTGLLCLYSGESLINLRKMDAHGACDLVLTKGNSPKVSSVLDLIAQPSLSCDAWIPCMLAAASPEDLLTRFLRPNQLVSPCHPVPPLAPLASSCPSCLLLSSCPDAILCLHASRL